MQKLNADIIPLYSLQAGEMSLEILTRRSIRTYSTGDAKLIKEVIGSTTDTMMTTHEDHAVVVDEAALLAPRTEDDARPRTAPPARNSRSRTCTMT